MTTKVTKVQTSESPTEAARQINDKAQSELDALEQTIREQQSLQEQSKQERAALLSEIEQRNGHHHEVTHILKNLSEKHRDALEYARIATGTIGETQALKAVEERKKEHDSTLEYHEHITEEYRTANEQAQDRLLELDMTIAKAAETTSQAYERQLAVTRVRDQAHAQLGNGTRADLEQQHQRFLEKIESHRQALVDAQLEERAFLQTAVQTLAPWSGHAHDFKMMQPAGDDATWRILTSAIKHLDLLIADGKRTNANYPRNENYYTWYVLLTLPLGEMETLSYNTRALEWRRTQLQQMLMQYESQLRGSR